MEKIIFARGFMNPEGEIMSMPVPELGWKIEKNEMKLPVLPDKIIAATQNAARQLVDVGGYIEMQRFTEMFTVTGGETQMMYKTYITYLKKGAADGKVNLFSEKDGKAYVWLSFDNVPKADDFYKNFEAGETVVEDITALMLINILASYNYSDDVKLALKEEIKKSPMFYTRGISFK